MEDRLAQRTTLFGRSGDRSLVLWDQHADLDGDGVEEIWFPEGEGAGAIRVESVRPGGSVTLALEALSRGVTDYEHLIRRHAYVPSLEPADHDGDGRLELVAFRAHSLIAWPYTARTTEEGVAPTFEVSRPFVKEKLRPDEVHTPRLELRDVDGDGTADEIQTWVYTPAGTVVRVENDSDAHGTADSTRTEEWTTDGNLYRRLSDSDADGTQDEFTEYAYDGDGWWYLFHD